MKMDRSSGNVSLPIRIAWGCGGWADNWMLGVISYLFLYVYVDFFHMDPVLAGVVLCVPRVFDAISDLYVGIFSDNLRCRWGRRRPLIVIGTVGCAPLLPMFFLPPFSETIHNPWYSNGPFWFLSLVTTLYYAVFYTLFIVPYTALGYELGGEYDERTKVLAWRMYLGLAGQMMVPWVYKLSVNKTYFHNIQQGAIAVSLAAAAAILILGCMPAVFCKENPDNQKHPQASFLVALKTSFSCIPFRYIIVGLLIITCFYCATSSLNGFVSLYVVCRGDNALNSHIVGWVGTITSITSVLSLLLTIHISRKIDKKNALIICLAIMGFAQLSSFITLTPKHPYWQLYTAFLTGISMQGCWLMFDSMLSDVCDIEELRVGRRSEGIFSSVRGFIQKLSGGAMVLFSGYLLKFSGFDAEIAQTQGLGEDVLGTMKFLSIIIPLVGTISCMILFLFYPVSRAKVEEVHHILNAAHDSKLSTD